MNRCEIFRAITSGGSKDGRSLFPLMPHPHYGEVAVEDIKCLLLLTCVY
ncbi:hypothetical protein [uncultured Sunxiuqinia sp.]